MKISQHTIAEYSGVSRGTVDRVLHNRGEVSAWYHESNASLTLFFFKNKDIKHTYIGVVHS